MKLNISTLLCLFFFVQTSLFADLKRGKEIYGQLCFNCHGPHLDGGIGPSLIDSYWKNGDSAEAIYRSIAKGISGTEMIAYEMVYSPEDLSSLVDFILKAQEGNRQTLRSFYPRDYFKGKRLSPALFDSIESSSQSLLPENHYYGERKFDGVLRGQSKLFIQSGGRFRFNVGGPGRTSIWVNGEEVHYSDDQKDNSYQFNKDFDLPAGIHDLEILHEEPTAHSMRLYARLQNLKGGHWMLTGKSLEGNVPKVVRAGQQAKVIRKWIDGLPPRTLLLLLPNKVLLAYDSASGQIVKGWRDAYVDQTPSLDNRSQNQSEVKGEEIDGIARKVFEGKKVSLLRYEASAQAVKISALVDGRQSSFTVTPEGEDSFSITF